MGHDSDGEDEGAHFRALRHDVKTGNHRPQKGAVETSDAYDCLLAAANCGKGADLRVAVSGLDNALGSGIGDSFDCSAASSGPRAVTAASQRSGRPVLACRDGSEDLVQFLSASGLDGPLKAYAHAFMLQGVSDSVTLISTEDSKLADLIRHAELSCTDELLFRDAVSTFR